MVQEVNHFLKTVRNSVQLVPPKELCSKKGCSLLTRRCAHSGNQDNAVEQEFMIEDAFNCFEESKLELMARKERQERAEADISEDIATRRDLPLLAKVLAYLHHPRNLAFDCNVPDASASLRSALNRFLNAIKRDAKNGNKKHMLKATSTVCGCGDGHHLQLK